MRRLRRAGIKYKRGSHSSSPVLLREQLPRVILIERGVSSSRQDPELEERWRDEAAHEGCKEWREMSVSSRGTTKWDS